MNNIWQIFCNLGEVLKTTSNKLTKAIDDDKKHLLSTGKVSIEANGSDANYCVLQQHQQKTGTSIQICFSTLPNLFPIYFVI
jgi:hypothetical protein